MKRIISFFNSFFSKEFSPDKILNNPNKRFTISQQKEVTEIENFKLLLGYYKDVNIDYSILNQNINVSVLCFSTDIWSTLELMSFIADSLSDPKWEKTKKIYSFLKRKQPSFLFFCEKEYHKDKVFTDKDLKQLVHYMTVILDYFEQNKTNEDNDVSKLCSAIFCQLDILYSFYFHLLCYLKNIDTSDLTVVVFHNEF